MEFYKIQNPKNGKFSSGVSSGAISESKSGKTWSELRHVKTHLVLSYKYRPELFKEYDNWDVIKYDESCVVNLGKVKNFRKKGK